MKKKTMKRIIFLMSCITLTYGQISRPLCGTPPSSQEEINQISSDVEQWLANRDNDRNEMKYVYVS